MKVLLLQDVYNLGRAGDVKKVANGYGRNFLLPQGLAVLATPGALKQSERIAEEANKQRAILNQEMESVAELLKDVQLVFPAKAGETGKLYGSITTAMVADAITEETKVEITKRQIDSEPLRLLGMHTVKVRLTIDLIPEISVVIFREGEAVEKFMVPADELAAMEGELAEAAAAAAASDDVVEDVVEEVEEANEEAAEAVEETVEEVVEVEAEATDEEEAAE